MGAGPGAAAHTSSGRKASAATKADSPHRAHRGACTRSTPPALAPEFMLSLPLRLELVANGPWPWPYRWFVGSAARIEELLRRPVSPGSAPFLDAVHCS